MKKNELIVFYGTKYKEMTKKLLETAQLKTLIRDRNAMIGIKPNLVSPSEADFGATTHPQVVEGVIEYLQESGFSRMAVLESSWVGAKTSDSVRVCGYDTMLARHNVPFWDLQKDKAVAKDCAGMRLNICERAGRIDFLINIPVLKGHCQTKITCALKNMKGLIPNSEKRRFHRMGLHDPIACLNTVIHQDFILVDSICGDLTFEDGGNPVRQDRLIAGLDPVLTDTFGCRVIGLDPRKIGYIKKAEELKVGSGDLQPENVLVYRERYPETEDGETLYLRDPSETAGDFSQEGGYRHVMKLAEKVCEVESCSACYGYLIPALDRLDREGLLPKLKERIWIGQGNRGQKGNLGVGNCTASFTHTLQGCPPTEGQMYEFLKAFILKHD